MFKIIVVLMLLSTSFFGTEVPNTLFGVTLGSTEASAHALLSARFEAVGKPTKDGILGKALFRGTMFGYMNSFIVVESIRGKIFSMGIILNADATAAIPTFNEIRTLMVNKYGDPDKEVRTYNYPYEANDGFTLQGIQRERVFIADVWEKSDVEYKAILTIGNILKVSMVYYHKGLEDEKNKFIATRKSGDL